jgi:hypothetical protein
LEHGVEGPVAKAQGWKTTTALTAGSATHKKFDFVLTCYEAMLVALIRCDMKRQLDAGTAPSELIVNHDKIFSDLGKQLETTTDNTFKWRWAYCFHHLSAVVIKHIGVRNHDQLSADAATRVLMPMSGINLHPYYSKTNMWFQVMEQKMCPAMEFLVQAAECHQPPVPQASEARWGRGGARARARSCT